VVGVAWRGRRGAVLRGEGTGCCCGKEIVCPTPPAPPARSDFFPIALGFLRNMPVVGSLLNLPIIRSVRARPPPTRHATEW